MAGLVVEDVMRHGVGPVSFTAEPGTFVVVAGPCSSGKSTVAGLVAGFIKPDADRILLDGVDLHALGDDELGRRVGWMRPAVLASPGPPRR